MLIIAVTGAQGEGKSSLLTDLACWYGGRGKRVEGFVAVAGERPPGTRGAMRYDLTMIGDGRSMPFAVRDESMHPPYRFDPQTGETLLSWARGLEGSGPLDLVILDEFGPLEAGGGGHMALWHYVVQACPEIVAIAVRKGVEGRLGERLGHGIDVTVEAGKEGAWDCLRTSCLDQRDWMRIGRFGAISGGFEASVGSLLHGAQVPFRGIFMASAQSLLLTASAEDLGKRRRVVWVAFISASLKAFSPAGNRLRPMAAIVTQGMLYGGAITLVGWNIMGVGIGGFFVGGWAALQGTAIQYLLVGDDLVRVYDAVLRWVGERVGWGAVPMMTLLLCWATLCGSISATVSVVSWRRRRISASGVSRGPAARDELRFRSRSTEAGFHAFRGGISEMARPGFWLPVLVIVTLSWAAGSPLWSLLWIIVRASVVGFLLLTLARSFDPRRVLIWMRRRGHWGPAAAFEYALELRKGTGSERKKLSRD